MKHRLSVLIFALLLSPLAAGSMVYAPLYEDHIPYCSEIANTAQVYAEAENAELISSLTKVNESTDILFVVAHGSPYGILAADGSVISWTAVVLAAVENGVNTLVVDSCSSGSAIVTAEHLRLEFSLEIYTSSDVHEPSRAPAGGTSVYSQMWIENAVASYMAGGVDITPQHAVFRD